MSPTLFNYAIDFVLERALRGSQGVQVGENLYLTDLTYANDIALLGDSAEAVQDALDNIDRFAKVVGRRIDASKTKVMSTQPRPGTQHTINLGGMPLEEVESFKYLGFSFTATGQAKDEISGRIGLARSAFARLKSALWSRRDISLKTEGRSYEALIRTIYLYGCETWSVRVEDP